MSAKPVTSSRAVNIGMSAAESAELLLASITDCALYMLDPAGHVATWNPGGERIEGYTASEIVGRHFSLFYTVEDRNSGSPERELRAAAEGRYETEGWRVRKDGTQFWAGVSITPVHDGDGTTLVGYVQVARDLSQIRGGEERLGLRRGEEAMKITNAFIAEAKRELNLAAKMIRTHLRSLNATLGPLEDRTTAAMMAKVTTLEWSLDRVTRSMDKVVALADEASRRLSRPPK